MIQVADVVYLIFPNDPTSKRFGPYKVLALRRGRYNIQYADYSANPESESYQGTTQVKRLSKV